MSRPWAGTGRAPASNRRRSLSRRPANWRWCRMRATPSRVEGAQTTICPKCGCVQVPQMMCRECGCNMARVRALQEAEAAGSTSPYAVMPGAICTTMRCPRKRRSPPFFPCRPKDALAGCAIRPYVWPITGVFVVAGVAWRHSSCRNPRYWAVWYDSDGGAGVLDVHPRSGLEVARPQPKRKVAMGRSARSGGGGRTALDDHASDVPGAVLAGGAWRDRVARHTGGKRLRSAVRPEYDLGTRGAIYFQSRFRCSA